MNKFISGVLCLFLIYLLSACEGEGGSTNSSNASANDGTAGSRSRFALIDNYLYTISGRDLQLYDIEEPASPNPWVKVSLDWDIETIFPYQNYVLIGSETGVHILDNTTPGSPQYITEFTHGRSCDPVVAENGIGYVTLNSAASCGRSGINQLDVLDLTDLTAPKLIKTYPMQAPSGLAIDGQWLFVCDGIAGLKVFDTTDAKKLTVVDKHPQVNCFDVIAKDATLYVSVKDRLIQYNYSSFPMDQLSELSTVTAAP